MPVYRVFVGAPSASELHNDPSEYHWIQIDPNANSTQPSVHSRQSTSNDLVLPPATLELASRRISRLYHNIIFSSDDEEDLEDRDSVLGDVEPPGQKTTVITWEPTNPSERSVRSSTSLSFFRSTHPNQTTRFDTQMTRESQSYNYSSMNEDDGDRSIANFPQFQINLHSISTLDSLAKQRRGGDDDKRKVNLLLAVLEVEGPDTITLKKGRDAGKETSVLRMILGDETNISKLTAWGSTAETWAGDSATMVKRGDIICIENILATMSQAGTPPTLTASPQHSSKLQICFRTLMYTVADRRLRPDLRLGGTDPAIRKVATLKEWFEGMAGIKGK